MSSVPSSEDEILLPKTERENELHEHRFLKKLKHRTKTKGLRGRSTLLAVLLSLVTSVIAILIMHNIILSQFEHFKDETSTLPGLGIPSLGTTQSVFMPEQIYRQPPSNASYQAWMKLFPKGKGYVSLFKMREVGRIPDFIEHESADGTGRFCIAAFHQMHCLYLLQSALWAALDGTIHAPSSHTLHCLDYLRTSIICAADTTLEPFKSRFSGFAGGNAVDGFGSNHQCRNFDELYHWAERMRYNDDTDAERFEG